MTTKISLILNNYLDTLNEDDRKVVINDYLTDYTLPDKFNTKHRKLLTKLKDEMLHTWFILSQYTTTEEEATFNNQLESQIEKAYGLNFKSALFDN